MTGSDSVVDQLSGMVKAITSSCLEQSNIILSLQ